MGLVILSTVSTSERGEAADMSGSVTVNHGQDRTGGSVNREDQQLIQLNFSKDYIDNKRLSTYLNVNRSETSELPHPRFTPSMGLSLSTPRYRLDSYYSGQEDENYRDATGTLRSESFSSALRITPLSSLPILSLNYQRTTLKDSSSQGLDNEHVNYSISANHRIKNVSVYYRRSESILTDFSVGGPTISLSAAGGLTVAQTGAVYVTLNSGDRILKLTSAGGIAFDWGSNGTGEGQFSQPSGVAVDDNGFVYVADTGNHRIQKFNTNGVFIAEWGSLGVGAGQFSSPTDIDVDNDLVYVTDTNNDRVQVFDLAGNFINEWGSTGGALGQFVTPMGIAVQGGFVYVADTGNNRVQKFQTDGTAAAIPAWGSFGNGLGEFSSPRGIELDPDGFVYVADAGNHRVQKFSSNGIFQATWGSFGTGDTEFNLPTAIGVDNFGSIYVLDSLNSRVIKFTPAGNFLDSWGPVSSADDNREHRNIASSYGASWTARPFRQTTLSLGYSENTAKRRDEINPTSNSDRVARQLTMDTTLTPFNWISFAASVLHSSTDTDISTTSRGSEQLVTNLSSNISIIDGLNLHIARYTQESDPSDAPDTSSTNDSVSLNIAASQWATSGLAFSRHLSESQGETQTRSQSLSLFSDINFRKEIRGQIRLHTDTTETPVNDGKSTSNGLSLNIYLRPIKRLTTGLFLDLSQSKTETPLSSTDTNTTTGALNASYRLGPSASFSLTANHVQSEDHRRLTFFSNFAWRWRPGANLSVSYSGGDDSDLDKSISEQITYRFRNDTHLLVRHEATIGGPSHGDSSFSTQIRKTF